MIFGKVKYLSNVFRSRETQSGKKKTYYEKKMSLRPIGALLIFCKFVIFL